MASWLSGITAFIAAYPNFAYGAVFLLALSEAVPIIGAVVPGTALIVAISALVPSGAVRLWPLLLATAAGAIVGDGLSFWLGHRYHRKILGLWPLRRHPELVTRSEAFLVRHGKKSVFLARFTPGVRGIIPLMAGVLQMPVRRFYVANVTSALAWTSAHVLPGVLIGASFGILGAAAKPLAVLLVLLILALWATLHLVRVAVHRGIPLLLAVAERMRAWAREHDTRASRGLLNLLDPAEHEARVLAALAILLVGAAWLFLGILEDVVSGDPLVRADAAVYQALQGLRSVPGNTIMIAVTELGDTVVTLFVALAVLLWLVWNRAWRTAGYWLAAVVGATALNTTVKAALHRARPGAPLYTGWSGFSFPSGHSTVNAVLYGFLAFLIARELRPAARVPVALGAAVLVALIAFSRLYLGAHWLSDVAGGLAFGTALLALLGMFYTRGPSERTGAGGLLVVSSLTLVLAGAANVYLRHAADAERYAVTRVIPTMAAAGWWASDWQSLPAHRIDLTGELEEPLTIQWAGSLGTLQDTLSGQGWRTSEPWRMTSALSWLTAKGDPAALPVVPSFASGRLPSLTLVHPPGGDVPANARLVLSLWPADIEITHEPPLPLWIGSVIEEHLNRPLSLLTLARAQPDFVAPRQIVAAALPGGRLASRDGRTTDKGWDGRVLLTHEGALE